MKGRAEVLTPQRENFPRWYQEVVARAELAESGPVRGTMVIRPYGYAIWERMQADLDRRIKDAGVENAAFPLLIPESYLRREAEHVSGFSPELAVVTHAGGKQLDEPVVVRPTSETIINSCFSKWISSYRDLPMLVNQWGNVVRWELRPRILLRTTEFLWQEGHTAHANELEAQEFALRILLDVYRDFMEEVLAIPVLTGRKTDRERFAGAIRTWTCEAMMRDGKALQMGTSHELGQNFSRAFETMFADEQGERQYVWQTSWGASARMLGALVMAHGDDSGLRLPPRLAPTQVVVLLVRAEQGAAQAARTITEQLAARGVRIRLDDRVDLPFGRRSVDWEIKGVPLRVEVGPRDLERGEVVLARRFDVSKAPVPLESVAASVPAFLEEDQERLRLEAIRLRQRRTAQVTTLAEVEEAAHAGFAEFPLALLEGDAEEQLNSSGVSVRSLQAEDGSLVTDAERVDQVVVAARAY